MAKRKVDASNIELFIDRLNFVIKTRAVGDMAMFDMLFQDGSHVTFKLRKRAFKRVKDIFDSLAEGMAIEEEKGNME